MPYDQTIIVPIVMGKEGVYGIRNADRVPMGGARLVRNVSLEGRTMRTEGGAASLGTAIGSAGRASLDYWRFYVSGGLPSRSPLRSHRDRGWRARRRGCARTAPCRRTSGTRLGSLIPRDQRSPRAEREPRRGRSCCTS